MTAFEEGLGFKLLERGKKSIALTRAGEVVQREGRRILKSVEMGLEKIERELEGPEMRVGYAPSLAEGLIEKAMGCLGEVFPKLKVSWHDRSTLEMIQQLKEGKLDLVLGVSSKDPEVQWEPIRQKKFRVAVPPKHRFVRKRFLKPSDLDGERLLLYSRHEYPGYWEEVSAYFQEHGVNAKVAGEMDGIASLRLGVEAGLGVAFVAEGAEVGKTIALKPAPDPICVGLGYQAGRVLEEWEKAFLEAMRGG